MMVRHTHSVDISQEIASVSRPNEAGSGIGTKLHVYNFNLHWCVSPDRIIDDCVMLTQGKIGQRWMRLVCDHITSHHGLERQKIYANENARREEMPKTGKIKNGMAFHCGLAFCSHRASARASYPIDFQMAIQWISINMACGALLTGLSFSYRFARPRLYQIVFCCCCCCCLSFVCFVFLRRYVTTIVYREFSRFAPKWQNYTKKKNAK